MTPEQIEHVNQSWQSIVLMGDTAIAMFYRRLMDIDPSTHPAWTGGNTQLVDRAGRVSKFNEKFSFLGKK